MSVTGFRKASELSPAQKRVEAIIKAAADLGIGGFALAKLRTVATAQIELSEENDRLLGENRRLRGIVGQIEAVATDNRSEDRNSAAVALRFIQDLATLALAP